MSKFSRITSKGERKFLKGLKEKWDFIQVSEKQLGLGHGAEVGRNYRLRKLRKQLHLFITYKVSGAMLCLSIYCFI
jgi:hypothetical protein